jgi:hypothetical protein
MAANLTKSGAIRVPDAGPGLNVPVPEGRPGPGIRLDSSRPQGRHGASRTDGLHRQPRVRYIRRVIKKLPSTVGSCRNSIGETVIAVITADRPVISIQ